MSNLAQEEVDRLFSEKEEHHTSHPEDRLDEDDNHSSHSTGSDRQPSTDTYVHSDNDDDEDTLHNMNTTTTSTATYRIPTKIFDANTGPKGVIADAQSFNRAKKSSVRTILTTFANNVQSRLKPSEANKENTSDELSESELAGSDDEEFMRQWRERRLMELASKGSAGQRRHSPSPRIWGTFDEVDANGYLDAIEKVPNQTVVVVCIYDPESNASLAVEDSLEILAQKHATTRFVKLHHEIAEMDNVGIPAILAYRAGDVFATLPDCHPEGLETLLRRNGVLG